MRIASSCVTGFKLLSNSSLKFSRQEDRPIWPPVAGKCVPRASTVFFFHCGGFAVRMSGDSHDRVLSRSRDCSGCRYISGVGLIGCGSYVTWCGLREVKKGRSLVYGIGIGFIYLGAARLLDIEPFGRSRKEEGSGP